MIQALQVDAQEWDSQIAERRLILVNEDIEATNKQIQSLEKQKNALYTKYKDLEFTLDEIRSDLETNQNNDSDDEFDGDAKGDFFTLLSELENEEAALRGELQSYQELQKTLSHDRRKYSSVNTKLKSDLDLDKQKLQKLQDELKKSDDELKDLQVQIDVKTTNLNDIIQRCSDLQAEEVEITEELKRFGEQMVTELVKKEMEQKEEMSKDEEDQSARLAKIEAERKEKLLMSQNQEGELSTRLAKIKADRKEKTLKAQKQEDELSTRLARIEADRKERLLKTQKQEEQLSIRLAKIETEQKEKLSKAQKKEVKLSKKLAKTQREYQKEVDKLNQELSNQNSISFWRNDRSLLIGKLKRAKSQLQIELQNVKSAQKRQDMLAIGMKRMFGENDPGDGTGLCAKEIVWAGIERLKAEAQFYDNEQLQIEKDYNKDLINQLNVIEDSLQTFYKHRNETIDALNDELFECTQDGYLKLLQSELSELQTSLSRNRK